MDDQLKSEYLISYAIIISEDLVTVMWANESFDPDYPDTYYEEVNKNDK